MLRKNELVTAVKRILESQLQNGVRPGTYTYETLAHAIVDKVVTMIQGPATKAYQAAQQERKGSV